MSDPQIIYVRLVGPTNLNGTIMERKIGPNGELLSEKIVRNGQGEGALGGSMSVEPVSDEELRDLGIID